ncbi:MAG: tetratricopeptide repeat protein [Kiritimatiellia bacterium]
MGTLLLWTTPQASAQDTPRELHQRAQSKLAQGAYGDAIPDLENLIQLLGTSEVPSVKAQMEMVYYNLALCHFFIGQFEPAYKAFETYVKKYRMGAKVSEAYIFMADCLRFQRRLPEAIKAYKNAMQKFRYGNSRKADIYSAIARCYLAEDKWNEAIDPLSRVFALAGDFIRRNWAATLLTTAYFKQLEVEKVYPLIPYILRPNSFASRSVAFNLAALEAGDELFAEERYREALWVHRLVYPHDLVKLKSQEYLAWLQRRAESLRKSLGTDPRELMRVQESIGELEEEIKLFEKTENYDLQLQYRIARGYMEFMRYREAREIFLWLHSTAPELAEVSLYLAYQCSTQLLPWDRAFEIGKQYMDKYPGGEFYDPLTLSMGQLYAKQRNWPEVIRHLTKALEVSPNHESGAECMFLIGYASFMEEKFADAITWLEKLRTRYPQCDLVSAAIYWLGMSWLFQGKYAEASKEFEQVLQDFPDCMYAEDAAFRTAVCAYGQDLLEEADERLKAFMAGYPQSKLIGEALMMRADIAGAVSRLDDAVAFYQQAMTHEEINIEFYNHCAFQATRILMDNQDYPKVVQHLESYIARNREGSNLPLAIYWIGVALWNSGERQGALRYYREAVQRYGKERTAIGIDMILDEWVGRAKRGTAEEAQKAWAELRQTLAQAENEGDKTMAVRFRRVLLYDPDLKPSEKSALMNELRSEVTIQYAPPAVLELMLETAKKEGNRDLAVKVARAIIETFTETDYALDARMLLASYALEDAKKAKSSEEAAAFYAEAEKHLGVIRAVFATSLEAGQAILLLAQLYRDQGKFDLADANYKDVLGVKGWKNLWPEALYGRGEIAFAKRDYGAAAVYFQRIYVLYAHDRAWAAKAYLRHAECLMKMNLDSKACEVLTEMRGIQDLARFPEWGPAEALIEKLGCKKSS